MSGFFAGISHAAALLGDLRRLARHGALRPFETHPDAPPPAKFAARLLRLGARAPLEPDFAGGLAACGPAAIKLGQALATRPDLVGPDAAKQLLRLQDALPPAPWAAIAEAIDRALPGGRAAHFSHIDRTPVGAASIAQVHRATLLDGAVVALKVLRPGVEERFGAALNHYAWAAERLEAFGGEFARLKPRLVIATFRRWTETELDLRREAGSASELADALRGEPGLVVPAVRWEQTTRRTLALEWVEGVKLTDTAVLTLRGIDRQELAQRLVRGFLAQAIGQGFFHADLHQGNIFLADDGRLVLIDFGIMGRLDKRARVYLAEILYGLLVGNYARVAEIHFEAGYVPPHHSMADFASALRAVGEPIRGRAARDISVANLLEGLFAITRSFDMGVQPHLLLLQKTMVMVEGVALALDPRVNMWAAAEPYLRNWFRAELGPEAKLADAITNFVRGLSRVPVLARRIDRLIPADGAAPPTIPLPELKVRANVRWGPLLAAAGAAAAAALGAAALLR